jgi:16S rRNA (adenine1518-N6/adenine1519-N6)-dimethyltransferase
MTSGGPPGDWPDFRALLRRHGIHPDKRLGQHFLFDPAALDRVVACADLRGDETILEVGAGLGSLTLKLASAARRVIAVEIDRRLIPALEETVAGRDHVEVVAGDILALDLPRLIGEAPYAVIANIPYNITSHLLRRLLEAPRAPTRLVLTVQREVADRVTSGAGKQSLLSLGVELYGRAEVRGRIAPGAFFPPPEVESAILVVRIHAEPRLGPDLIDPFFRMARAGFSQKRKKLRNSLAGGLAVEPTVVTRWLAAASLPVDSRAEDLRLEDWERLVLASRREGVSSPAGDPTG